VKLIWTKNTQEMAAAAAAVLVDLMASKPSPTIALPTGATPLALYDKLVDLCSHELLDLSAAQFFNLDEFEAKGLDDRQSYAHFLHENLFDRLGAKCGKVRLLQGDAPLPQEECATYEADIAAVGGLDVAVLGLGRNGHIGFNEPGSDWTSKTHIAVLADLTRQAQSGLYARPEEVPKRGLTMGIATIRAARSVLLLVDGKGKEEALDALLGGDEDSAWPVTALIHHPSLTVMVNEDMCPRKQR
jgi:glucosamine-6-phosphate deaminase